MQIKSHLCSAACVIASLAGCHRIFTGDDPTTSSSTTNDTTSAELPFSTSSSISTTIFASGTLGVTGGSESSSFSDTALDGNPSSGAISTSSSSSEDSSTGDSSTGDSWPCGNMLFECDPEKEDEKNCSKECKWVLDCNDKNVNIPGDECNKTKAPIDCKDCIEIWCGDDELDIGEECDNGTENTDSADGFCTKKCVKNGLHVFITSFPISSNLGGIQGAHNKCKEEAKSFDPAHSEMYMAWISKIKDQSEFYPAKDFSNCNRPYFRPDGITRIAYSFVDLQTNGPINPINVTKDGIALIEPLVWTRTNGAGEPIAAEDSWEYPWGIKTLIKSSDCFDWAYAPELDPVGEVSAAFVGQGSQSGQGNWTQHQKLWCSLTAHLYCFEQAPADCN